MAEYNKVLPTLDEISKPYWEACKRHELLLQKCADCGHLQAYPPMKACPSCLSSNLTWAKASGKGKIYTYSIIHRTAAEGWKDEVPYAVLIIELDEGPHMYANAMGCKPEDLACGKAVEVAFDDITDEVSLPKFKLA